MHKLLFIDHATDFFGRDQCYKQISKSIFFHNKINFCRLINTLMGPGEEVTKDLFEMT